MERTYTYNPLRILDGSLNQLRFELGDTMVEKGASACVLCDEEYNTILTKGINNKDGWKSIKIQCLKAIVMKLAYEVDYSVGKMNLELSKRFEHFKMLLDSMEKSMQVPSFTGKLNGNGQDEHYFYLGMQENPKAR